MTSGNGHREPEPEPPLPEEIEAAIRQALTAIGVDPDDGEVFVAEVSGEQLANVMKAMGDAEDEHGSWVPKFMSHIVTSNTYIAMAARDEMTLEELGHTEEEIADLANAMPELDLKDADVYQMWKQQAKDLVTIVDRAIEMWRNNAN